MNLRRRWSRLLLGAALAVGTTSAWATIDLVTLPPKDQSQLTIYNQEDLTLVRERRTVTFAKGMNAIQFSWAGTLIDPTSLEIDFPGAKEGAFRVIDAAYPSGTRNLLVWHIEAAEAGAAPIEIQCFASGLSWEADYVLVADRAEARIRMEGWVKVTNRSGEDYENAETRLIVGEINLVEKIADLARRGVAEDKKERRELAMDEMRVMKAAAAPMSLGMVSGMALGESRPKEVRKEGVSDYFLYSIEGRETIKDQWSKRMPSFRAGEIPFKVSYEFDDRKYGDRVVMFYKFKNDEEHKLGKEPLPDGRYAVYREKSGGGLAYVNSTPLKYVPKGEDVELNLGDDSLVTIEPKMMRFRRENVEFNEAGNDLRLGNVIGWDEIHEWNLVIRNSRDRQVDLKIVRHFDGNWEIDTKEAFEKKSRDTIEFKRTLEPLSEMRIPYTITTHQGSRANVNRSPADKAERAEKPRASRQVAPAAMTIAPAPAMAPAAAKEEK